MTRISRAPHTPLRTTMLLQRSEHFYARNDEFFEWSLDQYVITLNGILDLFFFCIRSQGTFRSWASKGGDLCTVTRIFLRKIIVTGFIFKARWSFSSKFMSFNDPTLSLALFWRLSCGPSHHEQMAMWTFPTRANNSPIRTEWHQILATDTRV